MAHHYATLPAPEHSGWTKDGDTYSIEWDVPEVQSLVEESIEYFTRGCSCRKGCKTKQCGCSKKSRMSGPGCECNGCTNTHQPETQPSMQPLVESSSEESQSDSAESETCSDSEEVEEEIVLQI